MSNLEKFNQTLEEFNHEVGQLRDVSGAYKKLQHLVDSYNEIILKFEESSESLEKIILLHKEFQESLGRSLKEIEEQNRHGIAELSKLVENKTDIIRKENKEFYKELDSSIRIKLDENKLQIKQLIESERNQIKQIFELEFAKNFRELRESFETEITSHVQILTRNQKAIKILIVLFGAISLALFSVIMYKLTLP